MCTAVARQRPCARAARDCCTLGCAPRRSAARSAGRQRRPAAGGGRRPDERAGRRELAGAQNGQGGPAGRRWWHACWRASQPPSAAGAARGGTAARGQPPVVGSSAAEARRRRMRHARSARHAARTQAQRAARVRRGERGRRAAGGARRCSPRCQGKCGAAELRTGAAASAMTARKDFMALGRRARCGPGRPRVVVARASTGSPSLDSVVHSPCGHAPRLCCGTAAAGTPRGAKQVLSDTRPQCATQLQLCPHPWWCAGALCTAVVGVISQRAPQVCCGAAAPAL